MYVGVYLYIYIYTYRSLTKSSFLGPGVGHSHLHLDVVRFGQRGSHGGSGKIYCLCQNNCHGPVEILSFPTQNGGSFQFVLWLLTIVYHCLPEENSPKISTPKPMEPGLVNGILVVFQEVGIMVVRLNGLPQFVLQSTHLPRVRRAQRKGGQITGGMMAIFHGNIVKHCETWSFIHQKLDIV